MTFVSPEAERLFAERSQRLQDVIRLKEPDRVPIILYTMFWYARKAGMTTREAMYDYAKLTDATRDVVLMLEPDAVAPPHMVTAVGPTLDIMGYRALRWPGHGVDDNASYQYIDGEYMRPEEYDDYIEDPSWFFFTRFLPRIVDACEPLAQLPQVAAFQHLRVALASPCYAAPGIVEAMQRMAKAGEEMRRMLAVATAFFGELAGRGYPLGQAGTCPAPYDYFADYLRGSKGIMLDLYRRKDKLLAAMEKAIPIISRTAIRSMADSPCKIVFMPMHWGLDSFMSLDQFKTFFWPQLRRVIINLIDAGLTPLVLWEGDCTSRLETIADIPPGKCIYWFERTDLALAKAVLGDVVCLRGNIPPSVFNTGTPDDVREWAAKLIKVVGKNGGFILDGAIGIPDEAKTENVLALYKAVHELGRYG